MSATPLSPEYLAESKVKDIYIAYSVPIPLAILSTALRILVQLRINRRRLAFDDYLIVAATIVSVAGCSTGLALGASSGLGRHIQAVGQQGFKGINLLTYVMNHLTQLALCLTKLSILALYYRAMPSTIITRVVIVTAVTIVAWSVSVHIALLLLCIPLRAFFDSGAPGKCFSLGALTMFNQMFNMVVDIWIFIIPLPVIHGLRISRWEKIRLGLLFSLGLGTCGLGIARAASFVNVYPFTDPTWQLIPIFLLTAWEPVCVILCANLPLIYKPFASACHRMRRGSSTSTVRPGRGPHSGWHVHKKLQLQQKRRETGLTTISTDEGTQSTMHMEPLDVEHYSVPKGSEVRSHV